MDEDKIIDMTPALKAPWRKALKAYKEHLGKNVALQVSLLVFGAIATGLGFVSPSLVILAIPLLFLPFCFSAQMQSVAFLKGGDLSNKRLFMGYSAYFIRPYVGSYRAIWNMFRSVLVGGLLAFLIIMASYSVFSSDPEFVSEVNNFLGFVYGGNMLKAYEMLEVEGSFRTFAVLTLIAEAACIFPAAIFFFMPELTTVSVRTKIPNLTSRGAQFMKRAVRIKDPGFRKHYYVSMWPVYLLMLLGFAAGAAIAYFGYRGAFMTRLSFTIASAISGGMFFFVLSAPYSFYVAHYLVEDRSKKFKDVAFEMAQDTLRQAEAMQGIRREALEGLERAIKEAEERERQEEEKRKREEEEGNGKDEDSSGN